MIAGMRTTAPLSTLSFFVWLLLAASSGLAQAQAESEEGRLSTWGVGEAAGQPNAMVMDLYVSGRGELAEDALVKYRSAKERAMDKFEGMDLEGLDVHEGGMSLQYAYDQQQLNQVRQALAQGKESDIQPSVVAGEAFTLVLRGLDGMNVKARTAAMVKIIETVKDSGLSLGTSGPEMMQQYGYGGKPMSAFEFRVEGAGEVVERARAAALADAKRRAERLAEQAGLKLGRIVSVSEQPLGVPGQAGGQAGMAAGVWSGDLESSHMRWTADVSPDKGLQEEGATGEADGAEGPVLVSDRMEAVAYRVRVELVYSVTAAE